MGNSLALRTGTVSGTLLSILPNVFSHDLARTMVLAAVGATVSFLVTYFLNWLKRRKNK